MAPSNSEIPAKPPKLHAPKKMMSARSKIFTTTKEHLNLTELKNDHIYIRKLVPKDILSQGK